MKILLCGATAGSNFGDFMLAKIFQETVSDIVGSENVYWHNSFGSYSEFFEKNLNNHNKYRLSKIDKMIYISGGYFFGSDCNIKQYIARFLRYFLIGIRCIIRKKPYIIIGMEVGQSKSKIITRIQKLIIKHSDYISVRNKESYDYVKKHIRKDVELTSDTAIGIPMDFYKFEQFTFPKCNKRLFLHINSIPKNNSEIIAKIVPSVNKLLQKNDYTVAISADQYSSYQSEALKEVAGKINTSKIELYTYDNPMKLCAILNASDLVITTKLHVGIFSSRFEKSVVSFSGYTDKIVRFYNQIGESDRSISLKQYDVETGYLMLDKYKDRDICINSEIIEMANNNLLHIKQFIKGE